MMIQAGSLSERHVSRAIGGPFCHMLGDARVEQGACRVRELDSKMRKLVFC